MSFDDNKIESFDKILAESGMPTPEIDNNLYAADSPEHRKMDQYQINQSQIKELNDRVYQYLKERTVEARIKTTYSLASVTSNKDPNNVILFSCRVNPPGSQIAYGVYANKSKVINAEDIEINEVNKQDFYLQLFRREAPNKQLVFCTERKYNLVYKDYNPVVNQLKTRCIFPVFVGQDECYLDIYDFASPDFCSAKGEINPQDKDFMQKIQIDSRFLNDFCKIVTSTQNESQFCVLGRKIMQIFDLSKNQNKQVAFISLTSNSYEKIYAIQLDPTDYRKSWVALLSTEAMSIQLIRLESLLQQQENQLQTKEENTLSNELFNVKEQVNLEYHEDGFDKQTFMDSIQLEFSFNQKHVLVASPTKTCWVNLDPSDSDYLASSIKYKKLQGSLKIFQRGLESFWLCQRDEAQNSVLITGYKKSGYCEQFRNFEINVSGHVNLIELLEFTRNGNQIIDEKSTNQKDKILRVTAIRDTCELQSWEVDSQNDIYFRSVNSIGQNSFRWPYYAFVKNGSSIKIHNMNVPLVTINHEHEFSDKDRGGRITKIAFSNKANLYFLVESDKEMVYYRLKVKKDIDFSTEHHIEQGTKNSLIQISESKVGCQYTQKDYCQEVIRIPKTASQRSTYLFNAYDDVNVQYKNQTAILALSGQTLRFYMLREDEEPVISEIQNIEQVIELDNGIFALKASDKQVIFRLQLNFDLKEGYKNTLGFQEFKEKIIGVKGTKSKIYSLIHREDGTYCLKIFESKEAGFGFVCSINNIQEATPDFISDFTATKNMQTNVMISSEKKYTRIYEGENGSLPQIKEMFDFIPDIQNSDSTLLTNNIRNCPRYNRFLMVFSYPEKLKPQRIVVSQFFTEKSVELLNSKVPQACWFDKASNAGKTARSPVIEFMKRYPKLRIQLGKNDIFQQTSCYQLMPRNWIFNEYSVSGRLVKQTNLRDHFKGKKILAVCQRTPKYLLTPIKKGNMETMIFQEITNEHKVVKICQFSLKKVILRSLDTETQSKSLYNTLSSLKNDYKCTFQFNINSLNDIAIAAIHPSGYILDIFVVLIGSSPLSDEQSPRTSELLDRDESSIDQQTQIRRIQENLIVAQRVVNSAFQEQQSLLNQANQYLKQNNTTKISPQMLKPSNQFVGVTDRDMDEEEKYQTQISNAVQKISALKVSKKFVITESKLIIWGSKNILVGNIKDQTNSLFSVKQLQIEIKRQNDSIEFLTTKIQKQRKDKSFEEFCRKTQKQDKIFRISCRDRIMIKGEEEASILQIEIMLKNKQIFTVVYAFERDREIQWHEGSTNLQICFDNFNRSYLYEPEIGLFKATSKEAMFEFAIAGKDQNLLANGNMIYGMNWGHRLFVAQDRSTYMVGANHMLFPYSFHNLIQHYEPSVRTSFVTNFYTCDYYFIDGQNTQHKIMQNTNQLEQLLDQYHVQNPNFILTVFKKERLDEFQEQMSLVNSAKETVFRHSFGDGGFKKTLNAQILENLENESKSATDVLDLQLELSYDRLVNKIMFYLSDIPSQFQSYQMSYKYKDLLEYSEFNKYIENMFMVTSQMAGINVLETSRTESSLKLTSNLSYLSNNFIEKLEGQDKGIKGEKVMKTIKLMFTRVNWMSNSKDNLAFLTNLAESENMQLFQNKNLQLIILYFWETMQKFFIRSVFLPFLIMNFLPVIVIPITSYILENSTETNWPVIIVHFSFILLLTIGSLKKIHIELVELWKTKFIDYVSSLINWFQLGFIASTFTVVYFSYYASIQRIIRKHQGQELSSDMSEDEIEARNKLSISIIITVCFLLIEVPFQIRIFDFFSTFVRALYSIVTDSLQIASMLFIVVMLQTFMFWVLDGTSSGDRFYQGYQGVFFCMVDSYRLALGDFEVTAAFEESNYQFIFWFIFFLGTLISLLIILNMVIAVMSNTFARIDEENYAHILREKLNVIVNNWYRIPKRIKEDLSFKKYLVVIEFDPVTDTYEGKSDKDGIIEMLNSFKPIFEKISYIQDLQIAMQRDNWIEQK